MIELINLLTTTTIDPRTYEIPLGILALVLLAWLADRRGLLNPFLKRIGRSNDEDLALDEGTDLSTESHTVFLHNLDTNNTHDVRRWEPGTIDSAGNETGTVISDTGKEIPIRSEHYHNITTIPQALKGDIHFEYSRKGFGSRIDQENIDLKKRLSGYIDENTALKNRLKAKNLDFDTQVELEYEKEGARRRSVSPKGFSHFGRIYDENDKNDEDNE